MFSQKPKKEKAVKFIRIQKCSSSFLMIPGLLRVLYKLRDISSALFSIILHHISGLSNWLFSSFQGVIKDVSLTFLCFSRAFEASIRKISNSAGLNRPKTIKGGWVSTYLSLIDLSCQWALKNFRITMTTLKILFKKPYAFEHQQDKTLKLCLAIRLKIS